VKKDILTLEELDASDFNRLIDRAAELKTRHKSGMPDRTLVGKSVGLIFDKPSTRTRLSFETAAIQLGATPIFISSGDTQMARNEPIEDTARVMSRYLDGIAFRTFSQSLLEEFAACCDIPVINALTDTFHPCQILSDLLTVKEYKGDPGKLKIAWIGDGNNMAHSWINAAAVLGFTLALACPPGYQPDKQILEKARGKNTAITVTIDPMDAARAADVVNTDVWASMGQEDEQQERVKVFAPYQVNGQVMAAADKDAIVMHCLPAHRGEEITADVLEGPRSVVWDQAENKMHMHKAVLDILLNQMAS
jgi:ornithine carbamoyltransferase